MAADPDGRRTVRVRSMGRVQGGGLSDWTKRTARGLGLSGWVRNRRDGSVEAVFSGASDIVAQMLVRCRQGPPASKVQLVDVAEAEDLPPNGFDVRPTV